MERTMGQKLLAEFIGTFTLVFVGVAAIMQTQGTDIVATALAYGLAVAVMVSALGHVSGGHFNPAVTLGMLATAKIRLADAAGYWVAQLLGGAAAAGLLRLLVPGQLFQAFPGVPRIGSGIDTGQAVIIEAVLTFFLVWVIFATAVDPEGAFGKIAGLAIGLTVTIGVLASYTFTGGALNPARWFGPAAAAGAWTDWFVWLVGPLAGGVIAASLYDGLILAHRGAGGPAQPGEAPHAWGAHGEDADAVVNPETEHHPYGTADE